MSVRRRRKEEKQEEKREKKHEQEKEQRKKNVNLAYLAEHRISVFLSAEVFRI